MADSRCPPVGYLVPAGPPMLGACCPDARPVRGSRTTRTIGLAALLLASGTARSQTTAVQDGGACPTSSPTTGSCRTTGVDPVMVADLTPTQWLFGHDQPRKLNRPLTSIVTDAQARGTWGLALDRAGAGPAGGGSTGSSRAATPAVPRRAATPPVGDSGARSAASERAVNRFLVEEWRRTELDVADSVHHANLERIFVQFDSAQRIHLPDSERNRILVQLDRMNSSNDYAWLIFKAEINRRANDALVSGQK
jgi:hypothetical protein